MFLVLLIDAAAAVSVAVVTADVVTVAEVVSALNAVATAIVLCPHFGNCC